MARATQGPLSTRYPNETLQRLERRARGEGHSRSALIQRYVAEGLEMDEHPGIVFRSGPAGRRPGLAGGPDLWEVIAVYRSFRDPERTASWLDLPPSAITTPIGTRSMTGSVETRRQRQRPSASDARGKPPREAAARRDVSTPHRHRVAGSPAP